MTNANLSNNALISIPASLLQLSKLEKLNLSHNRINHLPDVPQWSPSMSMVDLSNNSLTTIPASLLQLRKLEKLNLPHNRINCLPDVPQWSPSLSMVDLSNNSLTTIPASLLQLRKLETLNLSHNRINCLPDVPQWSPSLSMVDLSNNCLSSLPMNISTSALTALNLSSNRFNSVPLCVCTFTTLTCLDLSKNPDIKNLPCELCMLTKLEELNLNGLKRLKEPPKLYISCPQKCISYLQSKFSATAYNMPIIQLMVVGNPGSGKHTLVSRLQNRELSGHDCNSRVYISEWECRPNITKRVVHFRIWIFNSLEEYKSTHKCFLSQHSLYLLLFNLRRESEGLHELKFWLESISQKAPCSNVMIIGTHMDEPSPRVYQDSELLLQQAKMVAAVYENLETAGYFCIWPKESVSQLIDNIHSFAVSYPFLQRGE